VAVSRSQAELANSLVERKLISYSRAYEPPAGTKALPVNVTTAASEFEWNELAKRSGSELWCIRVPSAVRMQVGEQILALSDSKGLSQFKTSRLQNLKLDPASLKKNAQNIKPVGHLTTSKNAYHLFPSSKPKASSSSSQNLPKHLNLEQEPDLRPSLVDSMLPADQVGRGARSAGDTDRDLEREGAVKAELGLDGGKFAGAEEMQGLRLVVPDGRRQGFYLGECEKMMSSKHLCLITFVFRAAPIQPTRHFVLATDLSASAGSDNSVTLSNPTTTEASESSAEPKPRHPQPAGLKYRNIPFGAVNPATKNVVGGPGNAPGKDVMTAPNIIGREWATPETSTIEKKKEKKRKSTSGVESPAVAEKREKEKEKERKRKVESSSGVKSKRPKIE